MPVHVSWWSLLNWGLLFPSFLHLRSASFEESILQLNSNSKYNIPLKAPPEFMYVYEKYSTCSKSQDKYSTWVHLVLYLSLDTPFMLYFPYSTRSGALSNAQTGMSGFLSVPHLSKEFHADVSGQIDSRAVA